MDKQIKKIPSIKELEDRLAQILDGLAYYDFHLKAKRLVENKPVFELIDNFADTLLELRDKGRNVRIDLTHWSPQLVTALELNEKVGHQISQMNLKVKLLEKRERQNAEAFWKKKPRKIGRSHFPKK
ncbi:MAG: hypothetical protein ABID38_02660 [Candidatus Diapherotrites archaeon]